MEPIKITIPAQKYSDDVYTDGYNCYVAIELKKLGFKGISVNGWQDLYMENQRYKIVEPFNSEYLKEHFDLGLDCHLTIVKA